MQKNKLEFINHRYPLTGGLNTIKIVEIGYGFVQIFKYELFGHVYRPNLFEEFMQGMKPEVYTIMSNLRDIPRIPNQIIVDNNEGFEYIDIIVVQIVKNDMKEC